MQMNCDQARELISARLDGEAAPAEQLTLDDHLATCVGCQSFAADAGVLHLSIRLAPAPAVPDLTGAVLAATAAEETPNRRRDVLRLLLVAIGLVQIFVAIPALLVSEGSDATATAAQHLSAFDLALGIGFCWVAWRPTRARAGFLPIATVLVTVCIALSVSNLAHGHSHTMRYANHALALTGMLAVALLRDRGSAPARNALQLAA